MSAAWIQILLALTGCVILGKSRRLSEPVSSSVNTHLPGLHKGKGS